MAMPLEPETLPPFDPGELPDFIRSPEVESLARHVLARFDEFDPVVQMLREDLLAIAYVFDTKLFDPANEEITPHVMAKCVKAPPVWRCLTGYHFLVVVRQWFWDQFDENQRSALLYHELTHIEVKKVGKYAIRPHSIEEFVGVYRHFGAILPGRRGVLDAFAEHERANRPKTH